MSFWTADKVDTLHRLAGKGASDSVAAGVVGCTVKALRAKANREGLKFRGDAIARGR